MFRENLKIHDSKSPYLIFLNSALEDFCRNEKWTIIDLKYKQQFDEKLHVMIGTKDNKTLEKDQTINIHKIVEIGIMKGEKILKKTKVVVKNE